MKMMKDLPEGETQHELPPSEADDEKAFEHWWDTSQEGCSNSGPWRKDSPIQWAYDGFLAARELSRQTEAELRDLADRLKLEARIHAQEACTANTTIAEIYQLCTGATGEPGNWNGAEPVRKEIAAMCERVAELVAGLHKVRRDHWMHWTKEQSDEVDALLNKSKG
jgi:hypothetical protein